MGFPPSKPSRATGAGAAFLRLLGFGRPRYDLQGHAGTIPLPGLISFLSGSGLTGVLWVGTPRETYELEFQEGRLVHAAGDVPPPELRLGGILLRAGRVRPEKLQGCVDEAREAKERLGSFLVRSGRITAAQLQSALALQVQELFSRMMAAEEASFAFQGGARCEPRGERLEVNLMQILLQNALRRDEAASAWSSRHGETEHVREAAEQKGISPEAASPAMDVDQPRAALPSTRRSQAAASDFQDAKPKL